MYFAHNGTIDMDILNDMATNIMIKNPECCLSQRRNIRFLVIILDFVLCRLFNIKYAN